MITGHVTSWGQLPPNGSVAINWDHPIAQGLGFCVLGNTGTGAPVELVHNIVGTVGAGGVSRRPTKHGGAFAGTAAANSTVRFPHRSSYSCVGAGFTTLLDVGAFNTTENLRIIAGKSYDASHGAPYLDWGWFYAASGSFQVEVRIRTDTVVIAMSNVANGDPVTLVHTADGVTARRYQNGILVNSTARSLLPVNSNSQPVTLFGNILDGELSVQPLCRVMAWNRCLPAAEVALLTVDPYCFLVPR